MFRPLLLIIAAGAFASVACAEIIHVPEDQTTLQAALNYSKNGDEIVVADGVYKGPANRNLDLLGKRIVIRSANGPEQCIIDCQEQGRAFIFQNFEELDTVIQGLQIINGVPNTANHGGAILCTSAGPLIRGCVFVDNDAGDGGAIAIVSGSAPVIVGCRFTANTGVNDGGAIRVNASSPELINCYFVGNEAERAGAVSARQDAALRMVNCTFAANVADSWGGAVEVVEASGAEVVNCTFAENENDEYVQGGAAFVSSDSSLTAANCIMWGNTPDQIGGYLPGATISYSDIEGGWSGPGSHNIDANPVFADSINGGFHLSPGSPCIDGGDNGAMPPDALDLDGDGDTAEPLPIDRDGNHRFVDDPDTEDTGTGEPPIVDMGAFEFQVASCAADVTGDGVVDVLDLLEVLGAWGPCS